MRVVHARRFALTRPIVKGALCAGIDADDFGAVVVARLPDRVTPLAWRAPASQAE
jgi:hypothetical protein